MTLGQRLHRQLLDHDHAWLRIVGLALLLRLVLLAFLANEPLVSDGLYYHQAAIGLVEQGQLDTYWPPGLPLYEALVVLVFGKGEVWVRLAMLPWFIWLCRNFYRITYRLHSRLAANLGLLVLAIYPAFIHQAVEPLSYLPAAALLLSIFGRVQAYVELRKRRTLWQAGLLLGLLVLFRPSAALFVLALPALILFRRLKFLPGITVMVFAALVVGPWVWIASHHAGRFIPVNDANSRNFYLGNNAWTPDYKTWYYGSHWTGDPQLPAGFRQQLDSIEALPAAEQGSAYMRAAWRDAGARPVAFALRTTARVRSLLAFDALAGTRLRWAHHAAAPAWPALLGLEAVIYVLLALAMLTFWFTEARRELEKGTLAIIFGFLVVYALPYWFSFSHPSYHLPMLPLMLIPAAIWVERCMAWRRLPRPGKRHGAWLVLATLAFLAIQVEWVIQMLFNPMTP